MLNNHSDDNRLDDEFAKLMAALGARDDTAVEKHALTILDLEKQLPVPNCDRLKATVLPLALLLLRQHRYEEVRPILDHALKELDDHQAAVDSFTGDLHHLMANACARDGDVLTAAYFYRHALFILRSIFGDSRETEQVIADFRLLAVHVKKGFQANVMQLSEEGAELQQQIEQIEDELSKPANRGVAGAAEKEEQDTDSEPIPLELLLEYLMSAVRIEQEADQMVLDQVEVGMTSTRSAELRREEQLHAGYEEFRQCPERYPAILAKFEQAEGMYRNGLKFLEKAPEVDSGMLVFWHKRLASVLAVTGSEQLAAEIVEKFPNCEQRRS